METPLVTVICICYNQKKYVVEALHSVLIQTHQNIELIVVDDASTDGSKKVIRDFIEENLSLHFIDLPNNVGNCRAFNIALQQANGEYIIDLAADDVLLPNRIEVGIQTFMNTHLETGVQFSDAELTNENSEHLSYHSGRFPHKTIPQGDIYKDLIERYFICSPTMMFKKSVIVALKGYDESLSYEDFDFWIRSARKYAYCYVPKALVKKRIVAQSLSSKQFTLQSKHAVSTFRVCEKILLLNKTIIEQQSLRKRIAYEIRLNARLLNIRLCFKYLALWLKNNNRRYTQ
jgi:glycosyltransferase involved in cell wall biosynthesis